MAFGSSNGSCSLEDAHHARSVKVLRLLGLPVESQEGVGVAGRSVAQPVPLLQQTPPPHHLSALQSIIQVLRGTKNLKQEKKRYIYKKDF